MNRAPAISTPADLRAARMMLGLNKEDAALIFEVKPDAIRDAERWKTRKVDAAWAETYRRLEEGVQAFINDVWRRKPKLLLVYRSMEEFRTWCPLWQERLALPQIYTMAVARARDELWHDGHAIALLYFDPALFSGWRRTGGIGGPDEWAHLVMTPTGEEAAVA